MKITNILVLLLSLSSCNKLPFTVLDKGDPANVEMTKEQFTDTIGLMTKDNCSNEYFIKMVEDLLKSEDTFYLEKLLKRIEDIDMPKFVELMANKLNIDYLVENNSIKHIDLLLEFCKKKSEEEYKDLLFRLITKYILFSEPNRDLDVDKKFENSNIKTEEEWEYDKIKKRAINCCEFINKYKGDDIWNKDFIGKIVDIAILNHKFNAVKYIFCLAKCKGVSIKYISKIPFIQLLEYHYCNGKYKLILRRQIPTSNKKILVKMFQFLLEEGADILGQNYLGDTILFKVASMQTLDEFQYFLKVVYLYRGEEELCSLVNKVNGEGESFYYKKKKLRPRSESTFCKFIRGDQTLWREGELGAVLRKNWESNKGILTRKQKV